MSHRVAPAGGLSSAELKWLESPNKFVDKDAPLWTAITSSRGLLTAMNNPLISFIYWSVSSFVWYSSVLMLFENDQDGGCHATSYSLFWKEKFYLLLFSSTVFILPCLFVAGDIFTMKMICVDACWISGLLYLLTVFISWASTCSSTSFRTLLIGHDCFAYENGGTFFTGANCSELIDENGYYSLIAFDSTADGRPRVSMELLTYMLTTLVIFYGVHVDQKNAARMLFFCLYFEGSIRFFYYTQASKQFSSELGLIIFRILFGISMQIYFEWKRRKLLKEAKNIIGEDCNAYVDAWVYLLNTQNDDIHE